MSGCSYYHVLGARLCFVWRVCVCVCMICDVMESLNVIFVRARILTVLLRIAALLNEPVLNENASVHVIYVQHLGEPLLQSQYRSSS